MAESSFSNFQPPSPSNWSKCVWYFLGQERDGKEAVQQKTLAGPARARCPSDGGTIPSPAAKSWGRQMREGRTLP